MIASLDALLPGDLIAIDLTRHDDTMPVVEAPQRLRSSPPIVPATNSGR